jgi:hypothetical protein
MSNYKKRKKTKDKFPPFVALTWDLLNSKAYKNLPPSASKALPYFLGKVKVPFNDPNKYENSFTFSYKEGKRLGFSSSTFHKVICQLVEKGFIDPVQKGGLRSDAKTFNFFKLSRRHERYGENDFKKLDWKTFEPEIRIKATQKKEMNSFTKGNEMPSEEKSISINELVGAF